MSFSSDTGNTEDNEPAVYKIEKILEGRNSNSKLEI